MLKRGSGTAHQGGFLDLDWDAPTMKDDGTPLTDLVSYRIYTAEDPSAQAASGGVEVVAVALFEEPSPRALPVSE